MGSSLSKTEASTDCIGGKAKRGLERAEEGKQHTSRTGSGIDLDVLFICSSCCLLASNLISQAVAGGILSNLESRVVKNVGNLLKGESQQREGREGVGSSRLIGVTLDAIDDFCEL